MEERVLRVLAGLAVLAAVATGCGSDDPAPAAATPTPTPTSTPTPTATEEPHAEEVHRFERGHNDAVRDYYGEGHEHEGGAASIEAEYHQPPKPATADQGDAITLTGTNIGVRARVTVTGVTDPVRAARAPKPGKRFVAVGLRLRTTGIAQLQDDLNGILHHPGGKAKSLLGVKAPCSNGLQGFMGVDVGRTKRGCLVFELPESAQPREFALALEQVPTEAGGRWRLR
jgi:hypothetical protein